MAADNGWLKRSFPVHSVYVIKAASNKAWKLDGVEVVFGAGDMAIRETLGVVGGRSRECEGKEDEALLPLKGIDVYRHAGCE